MPRHRRRRRKMGGSLKSFWNKAKGFLKRTKLLSTIGSRLLPMTGAFRPLAGAALGMVKRSGYGRGGALRPAGMRRMMYKRRGRGCCGGSLVPVGGMRRRRRRGLPRRTPTVYSS